jgi:hypothetical protein
VRGEGRPVGERERGKGVDGGRDRPTVRSCARAAASASGVPSKEKGRVQWEEGSSEIIQLSHHRTDFR